MDDGEIEKLLDGMTSDPLGTCRSRPTSVPPPHPMDYFQTRRGLLSQKPPSAKVAEHAKPLNMHNVTRAARCNPECFWRPSRQKTDIRRRFSPAMEKFSHYRYVDRLI
jgi:hypothetical protein